MLSANLEVVDQEEEHQTRHVSGSIPTPPLSVHRCQQGGLWGQIGGSGVVRDLDNRGNQSTLQQQGDVSCDKSSHQLPR